VVDIISSFRTIFSTCDMYDQPGSTGFRALFESALRTYEQTTGIRLAEHPLAVISELPLRRVLLLPLWKTKYRPSMNSEERIAS